jgi:hypothetical protein
MSLSSQVTMAPPTPPRISQMSQLELDGWTTLRYRVDEMVTTVMPCSATTRKSYRPAGRDCRVAVPALQFRDLMKSHCVGVPYASWRKIWDPAGRFLP